MLFSTYCRDVLQIHKRAETGYTDPVRSVQLKDKRALNRGIQSVKFSVNPVHTHVIISNSVNRPIPRVSCSVVQALNGNVTTRWFKWRRSQLDPRSLPSARKFWRGYLPCHDTCQSKQKRARVTWPATSEASFSTSLLRYLILGL